MYTIASLIIQYVVALIGSQWESVFQPKTVKTSKRILGGDFNILHF